MRFGFFLFNPLNSIFILQKMSMMKILLEFLNFNAKLAAVLTNIYARAGQSALMFLGDFYYGSTRWY